MEGWSVSNYSDIIRSRNLALLFYNVGNWGLEGGCLPDKYARAGNRAPEPDSYSSAVSTTTCWATEWLESIKRSSKPSFIHSTNVFQGSVLGQALGKRMCIFVSLPTAFKIFVLVSNSFVMMCAGAIFFVFTLPSVHTSSNIPSALCFFFSDSKMPITWV